MLHELVASPGGERLAFANNRHELWLLDLGGAPRKLDQSVGARISDLAFSPDGRWLAYVWSAKTHTTTTIRLVECETGRIVDATTALREDRAPAWDPEGKYLYFISTRDFNPVYDALQFDLSFPEAMRNRIVVTLQAAQANPFVAKPAPLHKPRSDDDDDDDDDSKRVIPEVVVDADGLPLRMLPFPVDEGDYDRIVAAKGARSSRAFRCAASARATASCTKTPKVSCRRTISNSSAARRWRRRSRTSCSAPTRARWSTSRTASCARSTRAQTCPKNATTKSAAAEIGRRTGWLDLARDQRAGRAARRVAPDAARSVALAARELLGPAHVGGRLAGSAAALRGAAAEGAHAQRALRT